MSARRLRRALVVLLAVLVLGGVVQASAAQLTVRSTTLFTTKKVPCTTSTIAVTHGTISSADQKTDTITLTVPASCAGTAIAMRLYGSGGSALQSSDLTATAVSPTTTITLSTANRYKPADVVGAAVTLATWGVKTAWTYTPPAASGCSVRKSDGSADTSKPCSVTSVTVNDNGDGASVGSRTYHVYLQLQAPTAGSSNILLQLDLSQYLPANWVWSTSGVQSGNLSAYPGYACASLPVLTAYAPSWAANGSTIYFPVVENRAGKSGLICS